VWLAARVRVTKGAVIGAGAVIAAGSVVSGEIPPGVVAGGVPARVLVHRGERRSISSSDSSHPDGQPATEPVSAGHNHSRIHRWAHDLSQITARALSPLYLRSVSGLGRRPSVRGVPHIDNLGKITIGDDFRLYSRSVRSHFVTGPNGHIEIGNGVSIGSGAAIASDARIQIGDGVQLGSFVMIMDTDFHDIRDISAPSSTSPVVIEESVQLGSCVTVLKGAHIGRKAHIGGGSVVRGTIPAGAFASGVPARVLPRHQG
jgi:acetyltransferase-like isoleucine patch superfamily enzyme